MSIEAKNSVSTCMFCCSRHATFVVAELIVVAQVDENIKTMSRH
jgi:hypothetical protein